jgi:hypothetical protein
VSDRRSVGPEVAWNQQANIDFYMERGMRILCVDNIKMNLREKGWGDVDSIDLAQDRGHWRAHGKTVLYLRVP